MVQSLPSPLHDPIDSYLKIAQLTTYATWGQDYCFELSSISCCSSIDISLRASKPRSVTPTIGWIRANGDKAVLFLGSSESRICPQKI